MKRILLFLLFGGLFLGGILVGCALTQPGPTPPTVSQTIVAAVGGTVTHPDGATLVIPPGALDQDTTVSITRKPYSKPTLESYDPIVPLSAPFTIDLGGANAVDDVQLTLGYQNPITSGLGTLAVPTDNLLLLTTDENGNPWFRGGSPIEGPIEGPVPEQLRPGGLSRNLRDELNQTDEAQRTYEVVFIPTLILRLPTPVLDVPYYWQDHLPWCAPTSLSMVLNYHDGGVAGIVSNWFLAGEHEQDANEGAWPHEIMRDAGAPDSLYDYYRWDADLIPNNAFTSYVKRYTQGFNLQDIYGPVITIDLGFTTIEIPVPDVDVPPRPVELGSTTTWHAFVAVGSSDSSVWLHDSSGAFTGSASIADQLSWAEFRNIAVDKTATDELYTLILTNGPRPDNERHGSIVLDEGSDGSLIYGDDAIPYSRWQWDGDPYDNGYYWDDPGNRFPDDSTYGNAFELVNFGQNETFLPGYFEYELRLANVTDEQRTFDLTVELRRGISTVLTSQHHSLTVPAYSWSNQVIHDFLPATVVTSTGNYSIHFWLYESGVLQDAKYVEFTVR